MRKRLRKKKYRGEFQELCFGLTADLRPDLSRTELDAFTDRLLTAIEARDLAFGGSIGRNETQGVVSRFGRGTATDDDRDALATFLANDADVLRQEVGPLRDAWYE